MDHVQRAAGKLRHITEQIDVLERRKKAMPQVGGVYFKEVNDQVAFQRWRARLLLRIQTSSEDAVCAWLNATLSALTPEERECIAGDARELRHQAFLAIVAAELYQIALGEHQGQRR